MRRCLWIACLALALAGCAAEKRPLEPGVTGPVESEEESLWLISEKTERNLAISALRTHEPALENYINDVACRVADSYCEHLRGYVVRVPDFNASMAPNGFMQVWTGLLLRAENEAQLAAVLGHEAVHYIERHSLERLETTQRTANLLLAAQLGLFAGGVGGASTGPVSIDFGSIGQLLAAGYLAAYSRDQEREADDGGFRYMMQAGYAPDEAAKVWKNLMAEQETCDLPTPPALFASHPPSQERLETLEAKAATIHAPAETGRQRYLEAILPHRGDWLRMALRQRQACRTRVLIERLLERDDPRPGELYYYLGEAHRLAPDGGELEAAADAYRAALQLPGAPVETRRELGVTLLRLGETVSAREVLEDYLAAAPAADDAAMVRAYLEE